MCGFELTAYVSEATGWTDAEADICSFEKLRRDRVLVEMLLTKAWEQPAVVLGRKRLPQVYIAVLKTQGERTRYR